ncbi:MAG: SUMF1/EgtB/PvdO family nonheme iron enzyme [Treponema sp.]|nr:SUMF1/EgtB/PvdO family nonheme iron enzyme [Treponema sp.]
MVKIKWLGLLTAMTLLAASCKVSVTPSGGGENAAYKAGDTALAKIKIGNTEYDNTAEVYVTGPDGATIVGKGNSGVFIEGRTVILSPYVMGKYEVTQELYTAVMTEQSVVINEEVKILNAAPFQNMFGKDYVMADGEIQEYRPVEFITWYDAVYFCNALSEKMGLEKAYKITAIELAGKGKIYDATVELIPEANGYRLPTEAEWEFAARGGNPSKPDWDYAFSGSPTGKDSYNQDATIGSRFNTGLDAVGWYLYNLLHGKSMKEETLKGRPGYGPHQVGMKECNVLGIFDMSGNVIEWCYDRYNSSVIAGDNDNETVINPVGDPSNKNRIERGGAWDYEAGVACIFWRGYTSANNFGDSIGFRVVRSAP